MEAHVTTFKKDESETRYQAEKVSFTGKIIMGSSKKDMLMNAKLEMGEFLLYFNQEKNCYEVLDNNTLHDIFQEELIFGSSEEDDYIEGTCIFCGCQLQDHDHENSCQRCE